MKILPITTDPAQLGLGAISVRVRVPSLKREFGSKTK